MAEEKYYTPNLSEFHQGFEYEWIDSYSDNPSREKDEIEDHDISLPLINHGEGEVPFEYALTEGSIRVKYLSKGCIEELGWTKVRNDENKASEAISETYEIACKKRDRVQTKFTLFWLLGDYSFIAITERNFIDDREADVQPIYSGKCYNKSELRWIMDRLGIETEK